MYDRDHVEPFARSRGELLYNPAGHVRRCANGCRAPAPKHDPYCPACRRQVEARTLDDTSCGWFK